MNSSVHQSNGIVAEAPIESKFEVAKRAGKVLAFERAADSGHEDAQIGELTAVADSLVGPDLSNGRSVSEDGRPASDPPTQFRNIKLPDSKFFAFGRCLLGQDLSRASEIIPEGQELVGEVRAERGSRISGWVVNQRSPHKPVHLQVLVNRKFWWEGLAKRLCTLDPDGSPFQLPAGFSVDLPQWKSNEHRQIIEIKVFTEDGIAARFDDFKVTAAERYTGLVETINLCADGNVEFTGWAYDRAEPLSPVDVQVLHRDRLLGRTVATIFRADLKKVGFGSGCHGFSIKIQPPDVLTDELAVVMAESHVPCSVHSATKVEVRGFVGDPGVKVDDVDLAKFLSGPVNGFVDRWEDHEVSGWARSATSPDQPIQVDLLIDDHVFASTFTSIFRSDLQKKFEDHGFHAFHFEILPTYRALRPHTLRVGLRNIGGELNNNKRECAPMIKGVVTNAEGDTIAVTKRLHRAPLSYDPPKDVPRCALIVLNRNGASLLQTFFSSFYRHNSYPNVEIIVVDHGSSDESETVCQDWANSLKVRFVRRDRNYTFSESNNLGASLTDAELLFFVNNDISFCQDIIEPAISMLRDPKVGILGIRLLDTKLGIAPFTPPLIQHLGVHYSPAPADRSVHPIETRYLPHLANVANAAWQVPSVTGAFMVCRREEFEALGGFNEGYNYGYEDVDLCLGAILRLGKEVVSANQLSACHLRGYSRKREGVWSGETMLGNRRLLEQRFGYATIRRQRSELLTRPGYWSSSAPRIAFAVTEASDTAAAGDYFTAKELADELVKLTDAVIVYLEESSWYDLRGIDVLIVMRHDYDMAKITNAGPHLTTIGWARNWMEGWAECGAAYSAVWASSEKSAHYLARTLAMPVKVVPIATNPVVFAPADPNSELASDYCFTGSFWGHSRDIMYKLEPAALPFQFAIYGRGWDAVPVLAPYHRGQLPYSRMKEVYASTKIVIDDANSVTKQWASVNSRVFDAIAAGALVITNGADGAQSLFSDLLPTYRTRQELESLLWYYLEHENERRALVEELRQRVLGAHTYGHRARQVYRELVSLGREQLHISIKIGVPNQTVRKDWGDYHFALALKRALTRYGHVVRIDCLDAWYARAAVGDDVAIVLRGLSRYVPRAGQINILWMISHPNDIAPGELESFDHTFVASASYAALMKNQVSTRVSTLLQCTDPELFHPSVPKPAGQEDVLFVGNSRNVFRRAVKDAYRAGLDVAVYGTGWRGFLPASQIKGEHIENATLASYYAHAGVVLADHWDDMRDKGFISNRIFDCLAAGARVISDHVPGLEELFGGFVATYDGQAELPSLVEQLQSETDERCKERVAFAERIHREHSFDARAEEILRIIDEIELTKIGTTRSRN